MTDKVLLLSFVNEYESVSSVWCEFPHTAASVLTRLCGPCLHSERTPSSHSLTFPNALHVLIMIRGKGQRIPACLAAAAQISSGRRALVTGVCAAADRRCQPEENRQ